MVNTVKRGQNKHSRGTLKPVPGRPARNARPPIDASGAQQTARIAQRANSGSHKALLCQTVQVRKSPEWSHSTPNARLAFTPVDAPCTTRLDCCGGRESRPSITGMFVSGNEQYRLADWNMRESLAQKRSGHDGHPFDTSAECRSRIMIEQALQCLGLELTLERVLCD